MRFSLTGLVRLGVLSGLAACLFAIWLGRLDLGSEGFRISAIPHYGVINGFVLNHWPSEPRFLDLTSGRLKPFTPPDGDLLEFGSCSPWLDEEGEYQVVGRWSRRSGEGPGAVSEQFGLARYSLPSGRVLNRVPLDIVPSSHPCWFSGTSAHLIYAGSDGDLYHIRFDAERDNDDGGSATEPQAAQVVWECPKPGHRLLIRDPVLSTDPRLKGRLIVSMSFQAHETDRSLTPPRLWWLAVSQDGSSVISCGPLIAPESEPAVVNGDKSLDDSEERYPNLAATPDGRLILAYLWQSERGNHWQLRLAPVTVDPQTKAPIVQPGTSRRLCDDHVGELAPFSADGQFVHAIVHSPTGSPKVVRLATKASGS